MYDIFKFIWDPRGYFFWLLVVSLVCLLLERLFPWRKEQRLLRQGIWQDLFFLIFNGHFGGMIVATAGVYLSGHIFQLLGYNGSWPLTQLNLIKDQPAWLQFAVFLVLKDFLEWNVHVLLHRTPGLWAFHKVHHSIRELDWIGNFRFHIMEIVVYRALTYFPLVVLGVDGPIIFAVAVFATFIGHLNHANLNMDYGPLRFLFNSPRLHVWHHDRVMHGKAGQNFAIVFSLWDWLFGTIYYPDRGSTEDQPQELGFDDLDRYPATLVGRFFFPLSLAARRLRRSSEP